MKKSNKKGFTIVELVIVIAVIGILATVLIPTFSSVVDKANANSAMQEARNALTLVLADQKDASLASTTKITVDGKYSFSYNGNQLVADATYTAPTSTGYTATVGGVIITLAEADGIATAHDNSEGIVYAVPAANETPAG